eukprot:6530710-Prymnesium_polylepis.1
MTHVSRERVALAKTEAPKMPPRRVDTKRSNLRLNRNRFAKVRVITNDGQIWYRMRVNLPKLEHYHPYLVAMAKLGHPASQACRHAKFREHTKPVFARDGYAHSNRSLNFVRMRERVSRAASTQRSTVGRTVTAQ